VVREGLRLVEEREARHQALRYTLRASIDACGEVTDHGLDAALDARAGLLETQGIGE
jgi:antitoxin ParD1/3/4